MLAVPVHPANLGPTVPDPLLTISGCLMPDVPRPDYWDWWHSKDDVEQARALEPHGSVVTVGIAVSDVAEFLAEADDDHNDGYELLRQGVRMDLDEVVGYELVGAEPWARFHSWHCHAYASEVESALGIRLNEAGLLGSYAEAAAALDWIRARPDDDAPEPVPWVVTALSAERPFPW